MAASAIRSFAWPLRQLDAEHVHWLDHRRRGELVDSRPSQSAYALADHLAHSDPIVERFERWARARLAEGFLLDAAARAVGAREIRRSGVA